MNLCSCTVPAPIRKQLPVEGEKTVGTGRDDASFLLRLLFCATAGERNQFLRENLLQRGERHPVLAHHPLGSSTCTHTPVMQNVNSYLFTPRTRFKFAIMLRAKCNTRRPIKDSRRGRRAVLTQLCRQTADSSLPSICTA